MALQSMTGFARSEGTVGRYRWSWELRSVNGKGLDVRLRLPPGMDALETEVRQALAARLARGNLQAALTVTATENRIEAVLNTETLNAVLALRDTLGAGVVEAGPMKMDTLLSIRGLVDFRDAEDDADAIVSRDAAIRAGLDLAVDRLCAMREREGEALAQLLSAQIGVIDGLARAVEADPSRSPVEIVRKLDGQIALLTEAAPSLDRDRLHAEAVLMATKADLREEIDRLKAHTSAATELLSAGGPIGRKLDFIAQEFNREANTICSKSNAVTVTAAGIELKVVIDQFREQVQNLE